MAIDAAKLLQVRNRREWRDWLKAHHKTEREIWLVYFKKRSGKGRISYNDAVEEALCPYSQANREAWKNFRKLSPSYVRIRIGFIDGARNRPLEFQKRLRYFIEMTSKNRLFGFGGIEKYY
jgi:hypothetical protein